jgi:hypothetical protein
MANRNPAPAQAGVLPSFALDPVNSTGNSDYRLPAEGAAAGEFTGRALGALGAQFGEWAEAAARRDAEIDGAMAGLDPNYRPGAQIHLKQAAYDAAALKSYGAQLETKARASQEEAWRNWSALPADKRIPQALADDLDERLAKIEKEDGFPEVIPALRANWTRNGQALAAAAENDQHARVIDAARASTLANLSAAGDAAHRVAALPAANDGLIGEHIAEHGRILDEAVNNGQMTAAQAETQKDKFKQSVAATRALALFDNLPDGEKAGALTRFKSAYVGADYYSALRAQESGGNDAAGAKSSSAQGRYQFTAGTWERMIAQHPELGLTPDGRADAGQQEKAVRALTGDNAQALRFAGLEPSPANLYMAHFLGDAGAVKFLQALQTSPSADAAALFPAAAKANPEVFNGKTLAQVYSAQTRRFVDLADKSAANPLSHDTYDWLVGQMDTRVRRVEHTATTTRRASLEEIDGAKKRIADGYDVTPVEWSRLEAQYAASPDAATRAAFEQTSRVRGMIANFSGKRPEAVEAAIANMQAAVADGGTPAQRELIVDAGKWLDVYRKDIAKDPVQRYARDFGAAVAPLDFSNPAALQASISGRVAVAEEAARAYGLPRPRFLLESERAAFKTLAATGGPQMIEAAGAAMRALGARGADLLREVGGDDAPAFATAARVSAWNGDKGFLDDFAEWHRLSSDPATRKALELPKREVAGAEIDKAFGQALLALPELGASARVAAVQTYEVRALRNGWDKTLNDGGARAELSRAAQQALGATYDGDVQYGGVATRRVGWLGSEHLLAPGNLRADRLGAVIAALTDDDLKALPSPPLYADNRPASARAIAGSRLVSIGRGKYAVASGDPLSRDTTYLKTGDGSRFTLDLNALEDRLRARVPGAWR